MGVQCTDVCTLVDLSYNVVAYVTSSPGFAQLHIPEPKTRRRVSLETAIDNLDARVQIYTQTMYTHWFNH